MTLVDPTPTRATRRGRTGLVGRFAAAAAGLALAAGATVAAPAQAADNPYERGPAPSDSSISAARGPYSTSTTSVSSWSARGFGGGTIYYPTSTSETFGAVAISPGFTAYQSSIAWLGPRLASQGFVVFTIDTNTTWDQPAQRGDELLAALDYLTGSSSVKSKIDPSRLAVMGHSMGGGGTLEASKDRPSLKAAVSLTGWNLDKSWNDDSVPTLVVGGQSDTIAPVASHSIPFYNTLAGKKAYVELRGASHFAPNTSNTTIAKYSISWLKRFVDNDTRYSQFICPGPGTDLSISDYKATCPV